MDILLLAATLGGTTPPINSTAGTHQDIPYGGNQAPRRKPSYKSQVTMMKLRLALKTYLVPDFQRQERPDANLLVEAAAFMSTNNGSYRRLIESITNK